MASQREEAEFFHTGMSKIPTDEIVRAMIQEAQKQGIATEKQLVTLAVESGMPIQNLTPHEAELYFDF